MNQTLLGLLSTAIVLRELGCTSIDTLDDRILLQRKVYLVQQLGLPLGYEYAYDGHGTCSNDLMIAAKQIMPDGFSVVEGKTLKESDQKIIERVNGLADIADDVGVSIADWYELMALVLCWKNEKPNADKWEIINEISGCTRWSNKDQVERGLEAVCDLMTPVISPSDWLTNVTRSISLSDWLKNATKILMALLGLVEARGGVRTLTHTDIDGATAFVRTGKATSCIEFTLDDDKYHVEFVNTDYRSGLIIGELISGNISRNERKIKFSLRWIKGLTGHELLSDDQAQESAAGFFEQLVNAE